MNWTHGWTGLLLPYGLTTAGVLAGLLVGGAKFDRLILFPFIAVPSLLAAALLWSLVAKAFPPAPGLTAGFNLLGLGIFVLTGGLAGRISAKLPMSSDPGRSTLLEPAIERLWSNPIKPHRVALAGQTLDPADETHHFTLIGAAGSGKSTAIRELLSGALARGDRAVIADPDGRYLKRCFEPRRGDVILNAIEPGNVPEQAALQSAPQSVWVRNWINGQGRAGAGAAGGVLFLPYDATEIGGFRALVGAWMRLAMFEALKGPKRNHHLWFVIDELDGLGPIEGLQDAMVRLGKCGGRFVLAFQSIAQVAETYGPEAQAIIAHCGNTLVLRCSASEDGGTARFASRLIGEVDVPPTAIEQLPDRHGYLKLASTPNWRRVTV
jgi:hypothetical protein